MSDRIGADQPRIVQALKGPELGFVGHIEPHVRAADHERLGPTELGRIVHRRSQIVGILALDGRILTDRIIMEPEYRRLCVSPGEYCVRELNTGTRFRLLVPKPRQGHGQATIGFKRHGAGAGVE